MSIEEKNRSPVTKIFNNATVGILAERSKIKIINISLETGPSLVLKFFFKTMNNGIMFKAIKRSIIFIIRAYGSISSCSWLKDVLIPRSGKRYKVIIL
jgi:hypothetical protein